MSVTSKKSELKVKKDDADQQVNPDDSVSQCVSTASTTSSSKVRRNAAARKAALLAEAKVLKEQQELELKQLELNQQMANLKLKAQIESVKAEERVFAEFEEGTKSEVCFPKLQDNYNDETTPYPIDNSSDSVDNQTSRGVLVESTPIKNNGASSSAQEMKEMFELTQQHQRSMVEMMQIPKAELMTYDGDPLQFWEFWRAFEVNVDQTSISKAAKLTRLLHYCRGDARRVIQACSAMQSEEGYARAKTLLEQRFGNKHKVADAWMRKVTRGNSIPPRNGIALRAMADELQVCHETLVAMGHEAEMNFQSFLAQILDRLPTHLRYRWVRRSRDILRIEARAPRMVDMVAFINDAADEENDPVYGPSTWKKRDPPPKRDFRQKPRSTYSTNAEFPTKPVLKCSLCSADHRLFGCPKFKEMSPHARLDYAKQQRLCFNCLQRGHMTAACQLNRTCSVAGCGRKHTKFLHLPRPAYRRESGSDAPQPSYQENSSLNSSSESHDSTHAAGSHSSITGAGGMRIALPIVPVRVYAEGDAGFIDSYALLDPGSTSSFCTEDLKCRLNATGKRQTLSVSTLEKANSSMECMVISLQVEGKTTGERVDLPRVYTKERINVSPHHLAKREDIKKFPHLSDLNIPVAEHVQVDLLIGQDASQAMIPLEVRRGKPGEIYAVRTMLGWTLNGPLQGHTDTNFSHSTNFVSQGLEEQVQKFWAMESLDSLHADCREMSVMDKRVLQLWDDNVKVVDGHYELPIPFRNNPPTLENNKWMAEQRLLGLKRRLENDTALHAKYHQGMSDLLQKGYAEAVPEESSSETVWYLPHHPVINPKKPDKTRIVFDCASKFRGTSLNAEVLQGPDLTNNLTGVLLKFRKDPVALMADVEAMFHQVRVPTAERDVLRFLWYPEGDLDQAAAEYRMSVHLFGGTWSPSCCSYALKRAADDNQSKYSAVTVQTVKDNFYVDDCLVSVADEDEAIKLASELRSVLSEGGFKLTKWVSNYPTVLESIPVQERAKKLAGLDLSMDALPVERALGVCWDVEQDCFTFNSALKNKPTTRRGVLSTIASMYDPHGYSGPFVMKAKMLLQEMTATKLEWDEPLPLPLRQKWQDWQNDLVNIERLKINRCLKPHNFGEVTDLQLHHFSDASEKGYGAVSYLRLTNTNDDVYSSIVMAKSHLAPLKKVTIPRLELMAATLSVKLDAMIRRQLDLPYSESLYWSDSTIVLHYVKNKEKRFKTFVANRISTIHEGSEPDQWRHVDSKNNPADVLSRGQSAQELCTNKLWIEGPEFLKHSAEGWPRDPTVIELETIDDNDIELKHSKVGMHMTSQHDKDETTGSKNVIDEMMNYYSSWYKLKRSVAWILRVKDYLRNKVRDNSPCDVKGQLNADDMRKAEHAILKYVQQQSFPDEFVILQEKAKRENESKGQKSGIKKSSSLKKLDPRMFDDGLIHVGGRLQHASIREQTKHPIILPKMHHVVQLIIRDFHQASGHSGREYVLSLLRQQYWVIRGRVPVRQVLNDCVVCKRISATPSTQKMADLPSDRLQSEKPPFTYVGVDCFGPFLVKQGRSHVKRYGCIFTCLVVRAIHIEILHSLETDSFLNALQRFMARRGQPEVIRSDNGTNFVGAERELREGIQSWNQQKIQEHLLQKGIDWKFNPPSASHMGGSWERQIRTVRKVLGALLKQQALSDEGLTTLMCLVEAIINGRPLTVVSDDASDPEPLTPNHLLILRQSNVFPSDVLGKEDVYSRRRWRQIQYLANVFWRRWTREYLPGLQQRQKWSSPVKNLAVGDIVLIMEDLPRNQWLMGRIIETFPGRDNLVRTAKVKTKSTTLVRPIHKLCLIESGEH